MKRRDEDQPLFDFDSAPPVVANGRADTPDELGSVRRMQPGDDADGGIEPSASSVSSWQEVPQARFLSWPLAMQMAYCRDRDLDSAEDAESEEWQQFYLRRANAYDEASRA